MTRLWVESDYFDSESQHVKIEDYHLTRITSSSMDIQIEFHSPRHLTPDEVEPDKLKIEFMHGEVFLGQDFSMIQGELEIDTDVVRQLSTEEEAEIAALE